MTKNNYEAMNAQLLDELPRLFTLSMQVVRECVRLLSKIQQDFHNQALEEMYQLLGVSILLMNSLLLLTTYIM